MNGVILESDPINSTEVLGGARGYVPRDWNLHPYCCQTYASPFPQDAIIPRDEWDERLREMTANGNLLSQRVKEAGWVVKDQGSSNYCWANAVISCQEIARITQNDPYIPLSSGSVAAPIKQWKNYGGWGSEALDWTTEHGTATQATWPNDQWRKPSQQVIDQANTERVHFKSIEFYELPPGSMMFDCFISAMFHGWPCAPGYDWWRHQVGACDPWKSPNGKWGSHGPNSWGQSWGEDGWYYLEGQKSVPDDCICLHTMTPGPGP